MPASRVNSDFKVAAGLFLLVPAILGILACGAEPVADPTEPEVIFNFAGRGGGFDPDAGTKEEARFSSISDLSVEGQLVAGLT